MQSPDIAARIAEACSLLGQLAATQPALRHELLEVIETLDGRREPRRLDVIDTSREREPLVMVESSLRAYFRRSRQHGRPVITIREIRDKWPTWDREQLTDAIGQLERRGEIRCLREPRGNDPPAPGEVVLGADAIRAVEFPGNDPVAEPPSWPRFLSARVEVPNYEDVDAMLHQGFLVLRTVEAAAAARAFQRVVRNLAGSDDLDAVAEALDDAVRRQIAARGGDIGGHTVAACLAAAVAAWAHAASERRGGLRGIGLVMVRLLGLADR